MRKIMINELLVTGLLPEEKTALAHNFDTNSCSVFFETVAPVPETVCRQGDEAILEWRKENWGTPGPTALEVLDFGEDSSFGEQDSPSTLIRRFFSRETSPVGILKALSLQYPDAICTLRTAGTDGTGDDAAVYTARNGNLTASYVDPDETDRYIYALYRKDEDPVE